jgi:uncharacterized membrane protein
MTTSRASWHIPTGLLALAFVPAVAGVARFADLASGAHQLSDSARFAAAPGPVLTHVTGVTIYAVLGAFQFSPGVRRRFIGWHRGAGRLLAGCAIAAALSGMWLSLFIERPAADGDVLAAVRLVVGTAMVTSIVLAVVAVRRGDIARHRAWMIRGYALAMGAGTQAFTQLPWLVVVGPLDKTSKAVLMTLAWLINVIVGEWVIRRQRPSAPADRTAELEPGCAGPGVAPEPVDA